MEPNVDLTSADIKNHLLHHKFIVPTCQLYEASGRGFQTYGHNGVTIKNKIIDQWRKLFINENVLEIDTPTLTSSDVLTNSGHVGKFNDFIATDGVNVVRADHLIKDYFSENNIINENPVDNMTSEEMLEIIKKYKMMENTENVDVVPKNLMFSAGDSYLRPEIAQGIFVEFSQFYDSVMDLPFGLGQVGKSYRNEISPQPFVRLREFTQAEVEYFFDPNELTHSQYEEIRHISIPLFSTEAQQNNGKIKMTNIEFAVNEEIISNEIMAYYLATIYKFVTSLGLTNNVIRFREHMKNELAHYAVQCWDLEVQLSDGKWLECIGCAYRGNYDLSVHNINNKNSIKKYTKKVCMYKPTLNLEKLEKVYTSTKRVN